ncbi:MAG: rhodanese-like domain-containing protein [Thermodesulfobacteriota bacterium]|nr:rhodanese-like domain-containing protein [Thermodesulfobacteriota bacterium]
MKLQGKQIGALIAVILAVFMILLPSQDNSKYRLDPEAIAQSINEGEYQIEPQTLSEWIIEGRRDFTLIDIRTEEEFQESNIKGAVNIPLQRLLDKSTIEELPHDKIIVLYSNGSTHAGQAWLVMKTAGMDSYVLSGGLNHWNKYVLNPEACPLGSSDDEILRYKARRAVGEYLGGGGSPVTVTEDEQPTKKKKEIKRPPRKKKKLKGC